jgi:membrane protein YqaA with SNARE-associated domain
MSYLLTVLIVLLLIATIASLFGGLVSMGIGGELDDRNSNRLMFARVSLQAVAVGLVLLLWFVLKH